MTIHVNISEAKARLAELISSAVRGEEVIVAQAGGPQVRLTPVAARVLEEHDAIVPSRLSALGMYAHLVHPDDTILGPSMTDEELEERWQRKFGTSA